MLRHLLALVLASALVPQPAAGQPATESAGLWRQLFERDLDHLERLIPTHYIYAVHPGGREWNALFRRSLDQARREAALVRDFASYRAVLQHFVVSFQDAHFSAYFNVASRRARWPRFTVRYQGGSYVVAHSALPTVREGAAVIACDGHPLHDWVDRLAEYLGGPPRLETTRASIARQLFVDSGNPLHAVPRTCRIGDSNISLEWVSAPGTGPGAVTEPERTSHSAPTLTDASASISRFGADGAWVRIGTMIPSTPEQAAQFRQVIEGASALRDKRIVVIDVRGNSGGTYNWFMAFLRGLYGQPYADHHARARLEIANVIMNLPAQTPEAGVPGGAAAIESPADPPMDAMTPLRVRELAGGGTMVFMRPPADALPLSPASPPNPVRAKVYLLTDYGCASACISFVDEMMRFPGVVQIGGETHIDRRSGGWPERFELPSGLAFVRMGRMVREGRRRGENETWVPTHRFAGDIADTEAVQRWIRDEVIPRGD